MRQNSFQSNEVNQSHEEISMMNFFCFLLWNDLSEWHCWQLLSKIGHKVGWYNFLSSTALRNYLTYQSISVQPFEVLSSSVQYSESNWACSCTLKIWRQTAVAPGIFIFVVFKDLGFVFRRSCVTRQVCKETIIKNIINISHRFLSFDIFQLCSSRKLFTGYVHSWLNIYFLVVKQNEHEGMNANAIYYVILSTLRPSLTSFREIFTSN